MHGILTSVVHRVYQDFQVVDKWRYATEESSEREIRILSKVGHINCIKMHAVFVTARRVYIVTELVTGGELLDMCVFIRLQIVLVHL